MTTTPDGRIGTSPLRIALVGAIVVLIVAATWGLGVVLSGPLGRGEQIRRANSPENRTSAQAQFQQHHQSILSLDERIGAAKSALVAHELQTAQSGGSDYFTSQAQAQLQSNYDGLRARCLEIIGKYNADARSVTFERFRDADLPAEIDDSNPETDCREEAV